ncbi:A24 family peptidase [Imbroritus primus]|uniref:A24 family peptidase n=1 Tax=Imbroritus primus TaxID=3058603 RepID=UPI003D160AE1
MLAWTQAATAACALAAIWYDVRYRRAPNGLVLLTAALAALLLFVSQPLWPGLTWHMAVLSALVGLAVFALFYALGWMGAGDAKFFAVTGLLAGPVGLGIVWVVASLLGGLHALAITLGGRTLQAARGRGIPYAAYMGCGILLLLWLRPGIEAAQH